MKFHKIVIVAALSVLAVSAFAQGAGPAAGGGVLQAKAGKANKAGRQIKDDKILDQLSLTADQKSKIKDLKKKIVDELKDAKAKNGDDKAKMREAMKDAMKEYHQGLQGILTSEQQEKYKSIVKELREKRKLEGKGPGDKPVAAPVPVAKP